ncbi:MAG: transglutaminase protein [Chloroflexi bacterium]|nr:transglutaminase protein [Chloroflexota bacterium]
MQEFLKSTEIIDWENPAVFELARQLKAATVEETAKRCFEWVRDNIRHSWDYQLNPVTCTAPEVLEAGTGYCFAKSHLLAALLRANSIPAGLCYQRLSFHDDGEPYTLHGLNAVYLPDFGWYRVDARGNKATVNARFTPPVEQLAFKLNIEGEADIPGIFSDPLPEIVNILRTYTTYDAVYANLPDLSEISISISPK